MTGRRFGNSRAAAGLSLPDLQARTGDRMTAQVIGKHKRNESIPNSAILIAPVDALDVSAESLAGACRPPR